MWPIRHSPLAAALAVVLWATLSVAPVASARASEPSVEIFTLSSLPVTNALGATVHVVDALALLEQHLSLNLPADPAQAQGLVSRRMAELGPQLEQRARAAATALARAAQLQVQRAPVVVFDGRWAVYGMTDVDAARRIFVSRMPSERR